MRTPALLSCLAVSSLFVVVGHATAQEFQSFEPFDSIDGALIAEAYYDTPAFSTCADQGMPVEEGYFSHSVPFSYYVNGSTQIDAAERCSLFGGRSSIRSEQFRDLVKSRPPDYITSGHEWTFEMDAQAALPGWAGSRVEIEFTLNRPVLLSLRFEFFGECEARIGSIVTEHYSPLDGDIIDYYHFDSEVLGPGTHHLSAYAQKSSDRGTTLDAGATLWVRFDDAYCSPADLAEPFGMHDGSDIQAFIGFFLARDGTADLNGDGVVDLADIQAFVGHFLGGCVEPGTP